jgi:membrane-bound lytic murein transglycosylase D
VHLVFVESGFNPQARSYAAAVGPWQFIRGTAKIFGLTVNSWVDERKDPEASTVAAARYLKHLYGLFNSWPLALASNNPGEGAVIEAVKRQGTKDFWSLRLPQQTKDYVPKFMAVLAISRDPARYGFDDVELEDPLAFDEVTIPGPCDLRALANACGTTTEEIKRLNPMFLRNAAPAKEDMVTLRVPDGSGERLMSSLEDGKLSLPRVSTPDDPAVLRHKIRRRETLKSLGLQYGVSPQTIARYNHLGKKSRLRVGRTLLIPMEGQTSRSSVASSGSSSKTKHVASKTIKVRAGDTLSAIADRHGTTVAQLRAMNGLSKKAIVKAGQRLKVPAQS